MRNPDAVFIDTSIFDEQQYDFESREFKAFKEHFAPKSITLLMPNPTKREIVRHITEKSSAAAKAIQSAQQKAPFVRRITDWPLQTRSKKQIKTEALTSANSALAEFLDLYGTVDLDYSGISIEEIMNWYDQIIPPFGAGKKRKEFPDAFAAAALDQHKSGSGKNIAVIAKDGDWIKACESRPHLHHYESLSAYVEATKFEEQKIVQIGQLMNADSSLKDSICTGFPELGFVIEEDWDGEVLESEVTSVEFVEIRLSDISEDGFSVSYRAHVDFTAEICYDDYDSAVYDSEDKVLIPLHRIEKSIMDDVFISGSARLSVAKDWKSISKIDEFTIDQDTLTIIAKEHPEYP